MDYEGWCRRIDLNLRTMHPTLTTSIYKTKTNSFLIEIHQHIENKEEFEENFENNIRFITTPVKLIWETPEHFEKKLAPIDDKTIPSNFEGLPFTTDQFHNHLLCTFPKLKISSFETDFPKNKITITLMGNPQEEQITQLKNKLNLLKTVMQYEIKTGGTTESKRGYADEVFIIGPSSAAAGINCEFLERDEKLWFENIENIYSGSFTKDDLYFTDSKKTSCLVNYTLFKNCNLRSLILLYDIVYCVLPLKENMSAFLRDQKISKNEILFLVSQDRIKILNIQPEHRLDYGFLNEAYQEKRDAVISRRALAALCAIDIVSINNSYILSDPTLGDLHPLITELSTATGQNPKLIADYLLWPKYALRASFSELNEAGPMGIARYGVNKTITHQLPSSLKEKLEFEFLVHSDKIHVAHALDATYFPFYLEDNSYTDHPYSLLMGNTLNLYKNSTYESLKGFNDITTLKSQGNPTLDLISIFQTNDYISIEEYEKEISHAGIRKGMNSLFSELAQLNTENRALRINQYNSDMEAFFSRKNKIKHALDLGIDTAGCAIPFLSTILKLGGLAKDEILKKIPAIEKVIEQISSKTLKHSPTEKNISILSKVNRVAKLRRSQ